MSKPVTQPTVRSLMEALKSIRHAESKEQRKLDEKDKRADAALERFKATNPAYKKLAKAAADANDARWDSYRKEQVERDRKIARCRVMLQTRGVTEVVIKAIEKLIEEYVDY